MSKLTLNVSALVLAEPRASYNSTSGQSRWIEVLVDCPGAQGLFTYRLPARLSVQPGDILSVPFGTQQLGAIAIRYLDQCPSDLGHEQIREVEEVVSTGFFPPHYWAWLERVAHYYYTPFIQVIKAALPPGLLARSQRRIRLTGAAIPQDIDLFVSPIARQVLQLLQGQKAGDYSVKHLNSKIRGASRGIRDLLQRGWVESYLETPKLSKPKQQQAVTLVDTNGELTTRQRDVLEVLRLQGGEMWLNELLQMSASSTSIVKALAAKGCVVIQNREVLRKANDPAVIEDQPKSLTADQQQALNAITPLNEFAQVLLHGVTGSGKTEVYLQAIAPLLAAGKSALVLVPEIGLTPQLTDRFRARFGEKVCVYHSALSDGERYDTWRQMLTGESQVVIGTRSAIFAPLPHLGLIILDEEHDHSFKQDQPAPTYHARTVAQWRAELEDCPLILGSATPASETWLRMKEEQTATGDFIGRNYYLSLPNRVYSRPLPPVEVVDMRQELQRGNRSIFSNSLQQALQQMQARRQQGILFIHRRGHSTFVSCRSCGYVLECPHCDVSLSYHYTHEGATELLRCHYCNYAQLQPKTCPECSSPYLKFFGSGTQRVAQEISKQFPELRLIRFDSDTTRTKGAHRHLLTQFAQGEADLLVGTQMITKGIDLPQVTLVGIIAADGLLHLSDYRASERAFQTLTQVAGRAGRGDDPGRVILQTYNPEHPVVQAVQRHGYEEFIVEELAQRAALNYPPYGQLILFRLSSLEESVVRVAAENLAAMLTQWIKGDRSQEIALLGPAPAPIMRVANRYRWHLILKLPLGSAIASLKVTELRSHLPSSVSLTIDVDPLNLS